MNERLALAPVQGLNRTAALVGDALWWIAIYTACLTAIVGPAAHCDRHIRIVVNAWGWMTIPAVAVWVSAEEAARLLPFAVIGVAALQRDAWRLWSCTLLTALAFGIAHVNNGLPLWWTILCQGACGLVLNIVYLRAGGLYGRPLHGFLAAWALHAIWDALLIGFHILTVGR